MPKPMSSHPVRAKPASRKAVRPPVSGFDLSPDMRVSDLLVQMRGAGLQAAQLGKAAQLIDEIYASDAKVILTFTTNMVSSGLREVFAELCRRKKVAAIITAIGSVEEDVMKSQGPFRMATFHEDDAALYQSGLNRVGNILIPNESYVALEETLKPFFGRCHDKQKKLGRPLAPHEIIRDLGLEMAEHPATKAGCEHSFVYQAARNNIPIFCPAPTDGAFGLQLFFYLQSHPDFHIDAAGDLRPLSRIVLDAPKTAGLILGGGVAKHHAIGANILREGFDYAIYICTGTPYDGSLSGARPSEAVSWGKISQKGQSVHVDADASLVFPMLACKILG